MTDVIVQWDDQSINTVSFTDIIWENDSFRVKWVHKKYEGNWFGTVSEVIDENNLVMEWDKGGQNTVSVEDIKLVRLSDIPKQCYWRYDSTTWKGKIFLKAQKFNLQKHNQNTIRHHKEEQAEMESSDTETEPERASDSGSSTENESEEDSDDIDSPLANLQESWSSKIACYGQIPFLKPRTINQSVLRDPIEYFSDYFSEDFMQEILYQTNLYAQTKNPNKQNASAEDELSAFLGTTFYMSLFGMTNTRRYWSVKSRIGLIADNITQKRWEEIKSNLHFVDNTSLTPESGRLAKILPIITKFNETARSIDPDQHCSVDENTIPYKRKNLNYASTTPKNQTNGVANFLGYVLESSALFVLWSSTLEKMPKEMKLEHHSC